MNSELAPGLGWRSDPPSASAPKTSPAGPRPDFVIEQTAATNPERFTTADLAASLFVTLRQLDKGPGDGAMSFLTKNVKLSPAAAETVLGAVRVTAPRTAFDLKSAVAALCRSAQSASSGSALAMELEAFNRREAAGVSREAEAKIAMLDALTQAQLRGWIETTMKPTHQQLIVDYNKYLAAPGALDAMRTNIRAASQRLRANS